MVGVRINFESRAFFSAATHVTKFSGRQRTWKTGCLAPVPTHFNNIHHNQQPAAMPPRLPVPMGSKPIASFVRCVSTSFPPGPCTAPQTPLSTTRPIANALIPLKARDPPYSAPKNTQAPRNRPDPGSASALYGLDTPRAAGPNTTVRRTSHESFTNLIAKRSSHDPKRPSDAAIAKARQVSQQYMAHMPRRWEEGDVFSPRDLGSAEARKWRKKAQKTADVIDLLGINPVDHYSVGAPFAPGSLVLGAKIGFEFDRPISGLFSRAMLTDDRISLLLRTS